MENPGPANDNRQTLSLGEPMSLSPDQQRLNRQRARLDQNATRLGRMRNDLARPGERLLHNLAEIEYALERGVVENRDDVDVELV